MELGVAEFIFLRPVFIVIMIALIVLLIIISLQKTKIINLFSLLFILFICAIVSAITLYMSGYIVDAYGLAGDSAIFFMFLVIIGLCFVNLFVYTTRTNQGNNK